LVLGLVGVPALFANTFYVATTGSDSNSGTITSPFATVNRGLNAAAAGDTIYLRGGTYQQLVSISKSGTAGNPITIAGYPGESAILDGKNMTIPTLNSGGALVMGSGVSYITIKDLTLAHSGHSGIIIQGTHILVDHITAYSNWGDPVQLWGSYVTISNSISHDNALANQNGQSAGQYGGSFACGIYTGPVTDHCTITKNLSYNNWGDGLELMNATQSELTNNIVFDEWQEQIYIQNTTYSLISGNLSYVTAGNPLSGSGGPQHNIHIGDEVGKPNQCTNLTITNNFAMGGRTVLLLSVDNVNSFVMANNTFVNASASNGVSAIYMNSSVSGSASVFTNNIVVQDDSRPVANVGSIAGPSFSHNLWSKSTSMGAGTGDVVGNPQLAKTGSTAAGSLSPDWFKLLSGSPAISKALAIAQVKDDYFGNLRDQSPDIGGDEYGASSAGDATPPSTPAGLAVTGTSASSIGLQWNAATDNVGVTGYRVYRSGSQIGTTAATTFQDTGLSASTTYAYTVAAYDAAGNVSPASAPVSATTTAAPDTSAPSVPAGLTVTGTTSSSVSLKWTASTDNVGVSGYRVYRNGAQVASLAGTTFQDTGLSASTTYSYSVAAYDAAGNVSAASALVSGTTTGTTGGTTAPLSVAIVSPANGAVLPLGTKITLTGTATGGPITNMVWTIDGVRVSRSSWAQTSSGGTSQATWYPSSAQRWMPGYYSVGLSATDASGKTVQTSITVRLQ
jgi:chitodextrinase